ncbi:MAG: glycosyltransferase [Chthoniobacteraceae bacterium]
MKILLASSSSGSRGGGELYLLYLARALADRGHEPMLWASSHPRMDELARSFSSIGEVHRCDYVNTYDRTLRSLASYRDSASARRVADSWRASGAEFVHINKQNLEDGLDLLAAARIASIPSLCTIHITQGARYLRARFAGLRDAVSRRALKAYDGLLVTVPEQRRRELREFVGDDSRVRVVYTGVPLFDLGMREPLRAAKRAELGVAADQMLIVAVGRLVPQKRPLAFLEQARLIAAANPTTKFLWVGDGGLAAEWDARVAKLGLGGTVQRLPWQGDVLPALFAADVFLHVAEFEGLPLAILEAMSAGLPCAITEHLLAEMPFIGADDALCADATGSWIATLADRPRLAAMGARMRRLAEEQFSFASMAASYDALYRETMQR